MDDRPLSKGTIIIPGPLLSIMNINDLLMYALEWNEEKEKMERISDDPIGLQLLVNYCFGHDDSKLLLCPQSAMTLINHCSHRSDYGGSCQGTDGPNAKIQWAEGHWDIDTKLWLKKSL